MFLAFQGNLPMPKMSLAGQSDHPSPAFHGGAFLCLGKTPRSGRDVSREVITG